MYCPKCAAQAVEGQRYCRSCGINLGVIVDAMEGKRQPLDFDRLKEDLRQLGVSLRDGFEEAKLELRKTQQLGRKQRRRHRWQPYGFEWVADAAQTAAGASSCAATSAVGDVVPPVVKIKTGRQPNSRRYSLQQAMLSIFGGGAGSAALYYLLNTANASGLLKSIETLLVKDVFHNPDIVGITPVLSMLWVLGLIGVAKGFAHLINGIFFAPRAGEGEQTFVLNQSFNATDGEKVIEPPATQAAGLGNAVPAAARVKATPTNEFDESWQANFRPSVTEDETVRLGAHERQAEPK